MWSINRIGAAVLALLTLGAVLAPAVKGVELTDEEEAYLRRKHTIVFISQTRYPPFEFRGRRGEMNGMTVDLLRWMGAEMGFKVRCLDASFLEAQEAVLSRKADVITSFFYSDQRAQMFSFSGVMFEVPASIFTVQERTDISGLKDLNGKRIAVQSGDYAIEFMTLKGIDATFVEALDFAGAVHLVLDGKADAMIGDEQVVLYHLYSHSERDRVKRVGKPLYVGLNCMATRKADPVLAGILSKGIAKARQSGVLDKISENWLGVRLTGGDSFIRRYLPYLLTLVLAVVVLLLSVWIWNLKLRQQVTRRTKELARSESRMRAMFSAAEHVAFIISGLKDGGAYIQDFSPGAEKIFGYSADEMVGKPVSILHIPANAERVKTIVKSLREEKRGFAGEIVMRRKSGDEFSAILNTYPLEGEGGEVNSALGVVLDVSELKQAEARMRESEERYRAIFEQAADGLILMDPESAEILEFNQRACEHLGYTKEEFGRLRIQDIDESASPEVISARNRSVVRMGSDAFETKQRKKNGELIDVLIARRIVTVGGRQAIISVWRDITEQKRISNAIEQAKNEWERTFDSVPDLVCLINKDNRFIGVNSSMAAHLGQSARSCVGKYYHELVYRTESPPEDCPHQKLMNDQHEHVAEMDLHHLGGDFVVTATPLMNDAGELKGSIFIARDVTVLKQAAEEKRRLEAQVQQTQKLESLGVLAGGIAHDFNNLLMGILGNVDLAMEELPDVSPAKRSLFEIVTSAKRAADLCRQMLAYSGKGQFLVEPVDLNEIVEEMTRLLEVSVSKMAILRYGLAPNLPAVKADATQIRQVVMNLITNASEAIGSASGIISVCTGAADCRRKYLKNLTMGENLSEGTYVYVEVSDTGVGMDAETQAKIFDPFFTTKFTGRGLGLAAVHGIVRGHNGAIDVRSALGKGTTIRVLFPAHNEPARSLSRKDPTGAVEKGRGTVLLVDDEETVRVVAKRMLEKAGYDVLTAGDGRDAVETVKERGDSIDCVILDLTMPHMDGDQAFMAMREICPDIRVIVSSGYTEYEIAQRFASEDIAGFMQKPYELKALSERVGAIIGAKSTHPPSDG
ncbi:MAG: PAS domain S-box protein [Verrucomicrobia bacterium]|nr:PAS domain S-box protein [Verrucomicrobiota bacterium]